MDEGLHPDFGSGQWDGAPIGIPLVTSRDLPAMGQWLRLKRSFDVTRFGPQAQIVLRALKRYGMIVADNGSDMYISGAPNSGWDSDDLHDLGRVTARDFVVVNTDSVRPGNQVPPAALGFLVPSCRGGQHAGSHIRNLSGDVQGKAHAGSRSDNGR